MLALIVGLGTWGFIGLGIEGVVENIMRGLLKNRGSGGVRSSEVVLKKEVIEDCISEFVA